MTEQDDLKGLLGKAFGPEPPLRLDREEIFRKGRRGVRMRRFATSGGVAAAVVAVILGAAALNSVQGGGSDDAITPAQSSGLTVAPTSPPTPPISAPAGPQLPLTTTTITPQDRRAGELTQVLAEAKLIPTAFELVGQGDGSRPMWFVFSNETYQAAANLVEQQSGGGDLQIVVRRASTKSSPVNCTTLAGPLLECSISTEFGYPMMVATQRGTDGVLTYVVRTVRADGTDVLVTSGNAIRNAAGVTKSGSKPPVDVAVLKKIAALPRLTFG